MSRSPHHLLIRGVPYCTWLGCAAGQDIAVKSGVTTCEMISAEAAEAARVKLAPHFKADAVSVAAGSCPLMLMAEAKRARPPPAARSRARRGPLERACAGAYPGTTALVAGLIRESMHSPSWRPVRAAALMAQAGEAAGAEQVWMTPAEFAGWLREHFPPNTIRGGRLQAEMSIAKGRRKTLLDGGRVTRMEALACAHYAAGLKLPVAPEDSAAFADWFLPRFGAGSAVTKTLGLSSGYVTDRLKGYDIGRQGRVECLPSAGFLRAIDWVWRVGPFSPYGQRLGAAPFPAAPEGDPA